MCVCVCVCVCMCVCLCVTGYMYNIILDMNLCWHLFQGGRETMGGALIFPINKINIRYMYITKWQKSRVGK